MDSKTSKLLWFLAVQGLICGTLSLPRQHPLYQNVDQNLNIVAKMAQDNVQNVLQEPHGAKDSAGFVYKPTESIKQRIEDLSSKLESDVLCRLCKSATGIVQSKFHENEKFVEWTALKICETFHIDHADDDICVGIIKLFKNEFLTVVENLVLEPTEVCGRLLGSSCGDYYDPYAMWNITIPPKDASQGGKDNDKTRGSSTDKASILRVLHLSDIHVDMRYVIGANADCTRPMCCRNTSGPVKQPAGKWGHSGFCDPPHWTVENLFKNLAKNDKFDYILWTGDLPSHADWNQTKANQLYLVDYLTEQFQKYFPNTPVFSAVGNHESVPVNAFAPPFITGNGSISWLYDRLATSWVHWLPKNTIDTIKLGAYYTTLIKPGFRIVSLNMNYCNTENWWMLLNSTDPTHELAWLVDVLYSAEQAGEKVQILGHIPPGLNDCMKAWSWNYYRIVNRFSSTIAAQFFGHTHTDSVALFYDEETLQHPVAVAYVGPSVTTYPMLNPGYRVYTMDGFYDKSSWSVLDHSTYIMNLTEANSRKGDPRWEEEYSAKRAYNMTSLTAADWHQFTERMLHDKPLAELFHKYYFKSRPASQATSCDDACVRNYVCFMRTARSGDPNLCKNLTSWEDHRVWLKSVDFC